VIGGKSCSLDVRAVLADGSRVNIEVQVRDKKNMDRRSLFYWGKMYAETLQSGGDYRDLPDTIAINIVGYDFPAGGGAHTRFRLREASDPSLELTGAMEIHFLNVVKWRGQARRDFSGDPLHRWLAWLDPESPPETIEEVKSMDIAIAHADGRQKAVMRGRRAREAYEARQKADMDRRSEIAFAVEAAVAGKDAVIADREAEIAEWRGAAAGKDAEIERLQARLAELGA
ncbi:MAG: Rpn family recombination-promoting nuclease/putative transposase, partial [Treponema sp.]|nr:Rpn family recombination-promoting nuclease/putative transposase [Treponema sp.]